MDPQREESSVTKNADKAGPSDDRSSKPKRKYKKAPGAPKRFRSAFILFSQQKHKEIQEALSREGNSEKTTSVAKMVSEEWRKMCQEERSRWNSKARMDRERFEEEKSKYKGPWTVPIGHRRSKDPTAPKRPASAFLSFSNSRRAAVKQVNKQSTNAEISKILSRMWKNASPTLKREYQDKESIAREEYKVKIAAWRVKHEQNKKKEKDCLEVYQEKEEERKRKGIPSGDDRDEDILSFSGDGPDEKRTKMLQGPEARQQTNNPLAGLNLTIPYAQLGGANLAASQNNFQPGMLPALQSMMLSQHPKLLSGFPQDGRILPSFTNPLQINAQLLQLQANSNDSLVRLGGLAAGFPQNLQSSSATASYGNLQSAGGGGASRFPRNLQLETQLDPLGRFVSMQPQQQERRVSNPTPEQQREQDFLKQLLAARLSRQPPP